MDYAQFQHPSNRWRPTPLWSMNDRLDPRETARQMADMIAAGMSGSFFHSRHGLASDYMGAEWFAAMDGALQAARQQDGYLWLYDEDFWPSGTAAGQVTAMKDEYRAATLQAERLAPGEKYQAETDKAPRAACVIAHEGILLTKVAPLPLPDIDAQLDAERLVFSRRYAPKSAGIWGWESYVNMLNPEATAQFIRHTHEVYFKRYGTEFGKRMPGIFTDEPYVTCRGNTMPWDESLPARYREWHARDFWGDVPYLFFDGPEARRIRLCMHRTLLRQFCEAFSRQIFEWCERHGLAFTGHYMDEDTLADQVHSHGGGVMAHYRYMHIPGIDHLCRIDEANPNAHVLTVKQVSSAARQLGRREVLSEIFGVTRHTTTFEGFKRIADHDLVLGVTLLCPHLSLYSARGQRKRDYPPNWNYQQTYWKDLRPLTDYFTRLSYALTRGQAVVDTLLLHPIENATAAHRLGVASAQGALPEDNAAAGSLDAMLRRALVAILNASHDCDLGDEGYIEDLGTVEGDCFRIGEMRYRVVVVPPAQTWRPRTAALLAQFLANGGKVIFLGKLPTEIDCLPAVQQWLDLARQSLIIPCGRVQIQEALERVLTPPFRLRDPEGRPTARTFTQHRIDGEHQVLFVVNADSNHEQAYVLTVPEGRNAPLVVWNPLDASRTALTPTFAGDEARYAFTLPPSGSILLVTDPQAATAAPPAQALPDLTAGTVVPLPARWSFRCSEENVLVLDRLRVSTDGGSTWWAEDMDCRVRWKLIRHFGYYSVISWQPWLAIKRGMVAGKGGDIILRYRFRSAIDRPAAAIVIEDLTKGALTVNGTPVDLKDAGWHWDHDFGKVAVGGLIRQGENTIDFRVHYGFQTEVEPAYLVGDFGVRLVSPYEGEIMAAPPVLANGTWLDQGYPFYSGAITYCGNFTLAPQSDSRVFLRLQRASGILFRVRLNGKDVGNILWRPHVIELTGALQAGKNAWRSTWFPAGKIRWGRCMSAKATTMSGSGRAPSRASRPFAKNSASSTTDCWAAPSSF